MHVSTIYYCNTHKSYPEMDLLKRNINHFRNTSDATPAILISVLLFIVPGNYKKYSGRYISTKTHSGHIEIFSQLLAAIVESYSVVFQYGTHHTATKPIN